MKLDWRAVLGFFITVFLLWLVLRDVHLAEVWAEIQDADFLLLGLAVAIATGTFFLRALRWRYLLRPIRRGTSLRSRWAAVNIGWMANNLLPARIGEFARAYALARMEPVPVSGAFASLVVERFLDMMAILFLLFVAIAAPGFPEDPMVGEMSLRVWVQGILLLLGGVVAFMVVLLLWPRPIVKLAEFLGRALPGKKLSRLVVDTLEALLDGLKIFQNPGLLLLSVAWSLFVWAWQSLAFWVAFHAFGIDVGYSVALFVNATVAFAVAVPATPGFFGTFHAGVWGGLAVYGVPRAQTLALAFGFHLGGFFPVTFIGLYYAWKLGLSLREVGGSEERVEEAVETAHPELRSRAHAEGNGRERTAPVPEPPAR